MKTNRIDNSNGERDAFLSSHHSFYQDFSKIRSEDVKDYEEVFSRLLNSKLHHHLIQFELQRTQSEFFRSVVGSKHEMPVFAFQDVALVLKVLPPSGTLEQSQQYLSGSPCDNLIGVTHKTSLDIELFEESSERVLDQFDPQCKLKKVADIKLKPGHNQLLKKSKHVVRFHNKSKENVIFYILQSQDYAPLLWIYDPQTLLPTLSISSKQSTSRLELICQFLGHMKGEESEEALEKMAHHPLHFIRWNAVKNSLKANFSRGCQLLNKATKDPNPLVAQAAKQTKENLIQQGVLS